MADNFDNYSMKVQARVDMPSNKDIDAQIRKLEKSISKLKVSGQFDDTALKNLTNQLNSLKASITTANFSPTALTELTNQVNRALQNINIGNINVGNIGNQAQQAGQQIGQQINQGVSQSINVNDVIEKAYAKYLNLTGKKSSAIFRGQLDGVSSILQNDIELFEKFKKSIDSIDDASALRETVSELSNIKTAAESLEKTTDTLNNSINHSIDIDTTTAQNEIKEITKLTDNYGRELDELYSKLLSTSKMMNTQGKLITLFHGSPNEFDSFKINDRGRFEDSLGVGGYFYDNPSDSIGYGNVSQWFANVEKIFDTSAKLSTEEIQSVYDKYKTQIKEILDIDNLFDFSSSVNKNPISSLKSLSTQMGFDSSHLMRELGYDAIIDRGATSTYVILDENKIIKANSALKEQVSLITDIQEAKKIEENADPKRNWNQSVMDAMKAKRESSEQEISLSNNLTNTVIQNEEKKQQAIQETDDKIRSFSELKIKSNDFVDIEGLTKAEDILEKVRAKYEQFGQVTFKNIELDSDGNLKSFRVNIQQTNGDLKETRNFLMEISDDAKKVKFSDDTIKGTENVVRHLNEQKDATDQIIKEEEKLINAMADVREKSEQARQAEEKRQELAQNKAINKALEEEYNQKQKIIAQEEKLAQATAEKANKIQLSTDVTKLTTDYQKFGVVSQEVENNLKELKLAQEAVVNAKGTDRLATEIEKYDTALAKAKSSWKELSATQVSLNQRTSQMTSMQEWMRKNGAATKLCGDRVRELIAECQTCNKVRFDQIKNEFKQIQVEAGKAGKLGNSFLGGLADQAKRFTQWIGVSGLVMQTVKSVRQMKDAVIDVDTAMIELRKVSDASDNEIKNYFDKAAESAKDLGSSISDVINATADFSRLGYNLKDASILSEIATLYKNVGDGITIDDASSSIVSTMKAFGIEAENAMQIIDSFNEVGNNFAISSGEIGDALKRSASSLSVAGNSLSESIGLITAGNTIVQDADTVGTALKSMSLRITSTSADLEAMGEDTEFACETLSDYRNLVMGLTDNKVNIIGDNGEYKSTYEILKEISKVWDDMNSMEQSSLMKALFGVRQANIGASILENFDIAEKAMKSAEESAGSALKEQENYEKGIQYSIDRLIAKFQELSNHVLDSKLVKGIVDLGTTSLDVIDKITSALTPLGSLAVGGGLFASFKNVGEGKMYPSICFE